MFRYLIVLPFLFPPLYLLYIIGVYFFAKVPYISTSRESINEVLKNINIKSTDIVYELGCGKAQFLFEVDKKYHPNKLVGIEISPLHILYAKVKAKILKKSNMYFYCKDFFEIDISEADIIYLYLVPKIINKIWEKIKKEAKPSCQIITLSDKIENARCIKKFKTTPTQKQNVFFMSMKFDGQSYSLTKI